MTNRPCLPLLLAALLCLRTFAPAQTSNDPPWPGQRAPVDAATLAELRDLARRHYELVARRDVDGAMLLWSRRSPWRNAQATRNWMMLGEAGDRLAFSDLKLGETAEEGGRVCLRGTVNVEATAAKTGTPSSYHGAGRRNFCFAWEEGAWRLWRELTPEDELAERLAAETTEAGRAALLAARAGAPTAELVRALHFQGWVGYEQGEVADPFALSHLNESLAARVGDAGWSAQILYQRAAGYSGQGNFGAALENYQTALALFEEQKKPKLVAATLSAVGAVHRNLGNFDLALDYHKRALAIRESMGDKSNVAGSLLSIGNVHRSRGDYDRALEYFRRGLRLKREMGEERGEAAFLNNIANIHRFRGQHEQARDYYEKSLALKEKLKINSFTATTLKNLGFLYHETGEQARALEYAARATAYAREAGAREILWESLVAEGRAHLALGRFEEARRAFEESVAVVESMRDEVGGDEQTQQRFFESRVSPYRELVELLVARGETGLALAYAERAKGRALLDVLRGGRADVDRVMTGSEREHERALKAELTSLNDRMMREGQRRGRDEALLTDLRARLDRARLDVEAFQARLYAAHPELKARRGEMSALSAGETAALLADEGSAVLEYVVAERKVYLFVLTRDRPPGARADVSVHALDLREEELATQVERFRRRLAGRDQLYAGDARRLYDLLVKPAGARLRGKSSLVIVPDGKLWEMPFQALMSGGGRHLVEDHAVSYAPSLTVLREMRRARRGHARGGAPMLLAVGNPKLEGRSIERAKAVLMGERLDPLPDAERQVKSLGALYGAARSRIYTGAEAREETFKAEAGKYRVLQLATHGVLNDAAPMYSHVMLARSEGAAGEDGLLEAWEMMDLKLEADLVVLSACETARGRVGAGEGVIGMTWALFLAGSPTAVVSQWKVESSSTTDLMLEFHRRLTAPAGAASVSKAEALRQAAVKMLTSRKYRHPFYWAGFVVVGDGG